MAALALINIFNPAMAGYVVILVTFPADLNLWVAPRMGDIDYQQLTLIQTLVFTLTGNLPEGLSFDAISRATPLDVMKTGLIIRWQIPLGVGLGLLVPASIMYLVGPGTNPSPGFHLFAGATILCAFFIATDPVSAATSTRGRFVYGLGIGFLTWCIRCWGSYADGVAFAVLIMNMAVPAIDYLTRPRVVGHSKGDGADG
jgi:electron transport complex protein RnfD